MKQEIQTFFILHLILQWLVPILLVMLTYLSTWTISDPPSAVDITDQDGLKYKQCHYGWWDHCVVGGSYIYIYIYIYIRRLIFFLPMF